MTLRRIQFACLAAAAVIVATLGAILGHTVAPGWWTLTAGVFCAAVIAVWMAAFEHRHVVPPGRPGPVHTVARRPLHCPTFYVYGSAA